MICKNCTNQYDVIERYGLDGSDEYSEQEVGHSIDCPFYMINPIDRPYVKEVQQHE